MSKISLSLLRTYLGCLRPGRLVVVSSTRGLADRVGPEGFNQPMGGNELPRCAGIASMMRLPVQTNTHGLDVCFVGVPLDSGTSFRTGTRMGPRQEKYGPVCLIHVDAHSDTNDTMYGEKIAHGTPFRRAIEEGCLDCGQSIQIGLRGSGYSVDDYKWVTDQGVRVVLGEECWNKSLVPLMQEVRSKVGDRPVYLSFDIDGLDPSYAPGTGTPEIAGLTIIQGLEIIRGCRGLNIKGADLVEVSPPYDPSGNTALVAANLLFEMLCVMPGVKYHKKYHKK